MIWCLLLFCILPAKNYNYKILTNSLLWYVPRRITLADWNRIRVDTSKSLSSSPIDVFTSKNVYLKTSEKKEENHLYFCY